jgi:hypothetical protein
MDSATAVLALLCVGLTAGTIGFVLGQFLESRARHEEKAKVH